MIVSNMLIFLLSDDFLSLTGFQQLMSQRTNNVIPKPEGLSNMLPAFKESSNWLSEICLLISISDISNGSSLSKPQHCENDEDLGFNQMESH